MHILSLITDPQHMTSGVRRQTASTRTHFLPQDFPLFFPRNFSIIRLAITRSPEPRLLHRVHQLMLI
jgi:hypothetical protein